MPPIIKSSKNLTLLMLSIIFTLSLSSTIQAQIYTFKLGEKSLVNALYPTPGTNGYPNTTAEIIKDFLDMSLKNDNVLFNSTSVYLSTSGNKINYHITIDSTDSKAADYKVMMPAVFQDTIGGQALNGVDTCKAMGQVCWNPMRGFGSGKYESKWDIFMPVGLPMVSQKIIMLLHYPPYVSLEDHDYLKNNTMYRWERMLDSVGVDKADISLYESIIDINPIAAPGSGQSVYLPIMMAANYFDYPEGNREYITPMISHMISPPGNTSTSNTLPVIVFGGEAIGFWKIKYRDQLPLDYKGYPKFDVLDSGSLNVSPESNKKTAYMAANHPIAAVYQKCDTSPGIIEMEKQDLVTACFSKKLGNDPAMDPKTAADACKKQWMDPVAGTNEEQTVCANAIIDMSNYNSCNWEQAVTWCKENNNAVCTTEATPVPEPACYSSTAKIK